ncbi:heavy-metal-associated domain-containing protein [Nocardiopsis endophytica]|uniref:heavy-metal-associated domain-containing protein n=1 Tax=Nocardiopsis endophytica TaxID=3018445 RepID=UPI002FD9BB78
MSSCCSTDGSCSTGAATTAPEGSTVYTVSGMTCGHCRSAITEAVGVLAGVRSVDVDLEAGTVTVAADGEPDDALIAKAVDDAGYELTGRAG